MSESKFDAVIVGGRPAGTSLAVRLADAGWRVAVIERDAFPSRPKVPSMPLVPPHTVRMLEEIGLSEATAQAAGQPLHRMILNMGGHFESEIDFAAGMPGQSPNCVYSIQRDKFDSTLWEHVRHNPHIDTRQGVAATELIRNADGRVDGVVVKALDSGKTETLRADVVIGADGRFSFVARQVDAPITYEDTNVNSDFYFAYWEGLSYTHPDGAHTMHVYSNVEQAQVT
ncbi:MAG: NAD(P)/FAD-dependent oxidoreductase, partial [Chloroflexota bacterium]